MHRQAEDILSEYLVLAAQAGSRAAFGDLVRRWTPRLRRHVTRVLMDPDAASDVVQDSWLAIARGLKRLDDPRRFAGWAFAIASRRCADEIRGRQKQRATIAAVTLAQKTTAPAAEGLDGALDLSAALGRLPPDQRLLVSLFYGEGFDIDELAAAFRVPAGTIKSRLFTARHTLKIHLEGNDHAPD